ncbi:hypothetical protein [Cellulomonas sp. Leaf334]|uniref:hypothetical protein n=1 Tax=Cellulomonas sp. Leaf334 TaxID=1736339 RepID=UPI0006FC682A|nr:hypothetical protein [Cellulomonas sp. Leaf334]KQR16725.1 hypothetical protein ASF78_05060 [Cellulomonas sp. Leaf334]
MSWEPAAPDLRDNGHKILLARARDRLDELLTETRSWDGSPLRHVRVQVASFWSGQACRPFLESLNVADSTWRAAVLELHLATEEQVRAEDDLIDVANRPHEAWKTDGARLAQHARWGSR